MKIINSCDIIIVNCNNGENISRLIKSLNNSSIGDARIIAVDQNSTDGTREYLHDNVGYILNDIQRHSRAFCKNKALNIGNSPWVAFIDADCEITNHEWLDIMWSYTSDSNVGIIEGLLMDGSGRPLYGGSMFCLVRRACLNAIGYFDEKIKVGNEIDFLMRIEWNEWKTAFTSDFVGVVNSPRVPRVYDWSYSDKIRDHALLTVGAKYSLNFIDYTLRKNMDRRDIFNNKAREKSCFESL